MIALIRVPTGILASLRCRRQPSSPYVHLRRLLLCQSAFPIRQEIDEPLLRRVNGPIPYKRNRSKNAQMMEVAFTSNVVGPVIDAIDSLNLLPGHACPPPITM